jgi:hypothetical protein
MKSLAGLAIQSQESETMPERKVLEVQQGIWISDRWIRDAKLGPRLQVVVQPGEIRILPLSDEAEAGVSTAGREGPTSEDPVLAVAGILSGEPPSAEDIEQELYGGNAAAL